YSHRQCSIVKCLMFDQRVSPSGTRYNVQTAISDEAFHKGNPANQYDLFSHSIASSGVSKTLTIIPRFTATVSPNRAGSRRGSRITYANRGIILYSRTILRVSPAPNS